MPLFKKLLHPYPATVGTLILHTASAEHVRKQNQGRGVVWVAQGQVCGWHPHVHREQHAAGASPRGPLRTGLQHLQPWKEAVNQPCTFETVTRGRSLVHT